MTARSNSSAAPANSLWANPMSRSGSAPRPWVSLPYAAVANPTRLMPYLSNSASQRSACSSGSAAPSSGNPRPAAGGTCPPWRRYAPWHRRVPRTVDRAAPAPPLTDRRREVTVKSMTRDPETWVVWTPARRRETRAHFASRPTDAGWGGIVLVPGPVGTGAGWWRGAHPRPLPSGDGCGKRRA